MSIKNALQRLTGCWDRAESELALAPDPAHRAAFFPRLPYFQEPTTSCKAEGNQSSRNNADACYWRSEHLLLLAQVTIEAGIASQTS